MQTAHQGIDRGAGEQHHDGAGDLRALPGARADPGGARQASGAHAAAWKTCRPTPRPRSTAIEPFAQEQFDLVIYGCTAAGFLGGPAGNARMVERLRERTGATVVSTAGAMIDALQSAGVTETAVVTPYLAAGQ